MALVAQADLNYQFSTTIGTFTLESGDKRFIFVIGSDELYVGDRVYHLSRPARLEGESVVVPPDAVDRVLSILYGGDVDWEYDGSRLTVRERGEERPGRASSPSAGQRASYEVRTIVLDAGHGGKDPGGVGYKGIREKDIVLPVTLELEGELKRRLKNTRVVLTRDEDVFVSLENRSEIANSSAPAHNPLFVSVHANVSFSANTKGYETYFLSIDPFGEKARSVASMENSVLSYEIENYDQYLQEVINRIVDIEYRRESMKLAGYIQDGLKGSLGQASTDRGVKSAFFYVLKEAKMPAVLVEIGFVTHPDEAANLTDRDYQRKIAHGIADGIESFVSSFRQSQGFTD